MDGKDICCQPNNSRKISLPDDMLYCLAKEFLNDEDCLALALSGAFERFSLWCGRRFNLKKSLSISALFFITPIPWKSFFQQHIQAPSITTFDASHCYWLLAEDLVDSVPRMINLEQLSIHNTKVSLMHLPNIFAACQKIVKLSFTLIEKNLDGYQEGVMEKATLDRLVRGVQQLTHLKIFAFAWSDGYGVDQWLVILGVLKWCRSCTDLLLEVAYSSSTIIKNLPAAVFRQHCDMAEELASFDLIPHLEWMTQLQSFVFIRRGSCLDQGDIEFLAVFLHHLGLNLDPDDSRAERLARFWIEEEDRYDYIIPDELESRKFVSSVLFSCEETDYLMAFLEEIKEEKKKPDGFCNLEHLGLSGFPRYLPIMPKLKYARGICLEQEDFNQLCHSSPLLENLHISTEVVGEQEIIAMLNGDWSLPNLQTLVYQCHFPRNEILRHLIMNCPNIQELHIGNKKADLQAQYHDRPVIGNVDFLSTIQFQNLRFLTLDGFPVFDGSFLLPIVKQCRKLEKLHISGLFEASTYLSILGESLPLAANLRDLRSIHLFLTETIGQCGSKTSFTFGFLRYLFSYTKQVLGS